MKDSSAAIHAQVPVDVATFLLNEKRADIHRVESRLKVPIILIPNPHIETPNYTINRLRHDDLGGEMAQASYNLVEKPDESKQAQEPQKGVRSVAAVKGITPTQPAPMKVEQPAATSGLLGQIGGWFKSLLGGNEPGETDVASKPRANPRRERSERPERNEGGNRKRRDRNDKPERSAAPVKPVEKTPSAEMPARPQKPRPPKKPAESRLAEEKPLIESPTVTVAGEVETEAEKTEKSNARRRGRRGGRREREKREIAPGADAGGAEAGGTDTTSAALTPEVTVVIEPDTRLKPTEYVAMPANYVAAESVAVAAVENVAVAAVESVAVAAVETAAAPTETIAPVVAPVTAGVTLQQIETAPGKIVADTITDKPQPVVRRRTRQLEVYVENEPLVQIETQHPKA